ncbi:PfkB family carbohydrate kinase [Mycetocola miduiensis]|uniref:Fructoselysine 6-kinase n=1 Tax=Mycetocola miduiensis TaxID=995034 RepID=A0A1I5C3T2_9MICO|nr:PfkB family carbohydrate kinase [Mycetocola miduiensis]SFN81638.1 fructoselysine 6-kinase [Mycetocola miduiensis]
MPPRIVAVGDNVVDCYPEHARMFPGGNCVNVSVFAARFGADTAYIGAIADDAAGALLRNSLAAEGVDIQRLRTVKGCTAYCVVGNADGDRVFVSSDKGVSEFQPDSEDLDFVSGFDAVHIGASSGLDSHLDTFSGLARLSYDFSIRRDQSHVTSVAPLCYLASFSGGDLTDTEIAELIETSCAAGAEWTLVTRGDRGAILTNAAETWTSSATPTTVVDTLGAGDTFSARVLVGLLRGEDPGSFLADAASAASATCTQLGAFGFGSNLQLPLHTTS